MNKNSGSLVVLGCGIKSIAHLSVETITYVQQADKVFYSVNEPIIEQWIQKNNLNSESLDSDEIQNKLRIDIYQKNIDQILNAVHQNLNVCVVFMGIRRFLLILHWQLLKKLIRQELRH